MVKPARVCQCLSGGAIMKLTNTVTNITKNNKGFSLLEVLVGVSIIGIISAIAVPQFVTYRETSALTASDTSLKNMSKAYNLCVATKTSCTSKAALNIDCATCAEPEINGQDVCFEIKTVVSNKTFQACLSRAASGTVVTKYGGDFKFCTYTTVSPGTPAVVATTEICDANPDCSTTQANTTGACLTTGTAVGVCNGSGLCN